MEERPGDSLVRMVLASWFSAMTVSRANHESKVLSYARKKPDRGEDNSVIGSRECEDEAKLARLESRTTSTTPS